MPFNLINGSMNGLNTVFTLLQLHSSLLKGLLFSSSFQLTDISFILGLNVKREKNGQCWELKDLFYSFKVLLFQNREKKEKNRWIGKFKNNRPMFLSKNIFILDFNNWQISNTNWKSCLGQLWLLFAKFEILISPLLLHSFLSWESSNKLERQLHLKTVCSKKAKERTNERTNEILLSKKAKEEEKEVCQKKV
jgi:hypothetical protein